MPYVANAEVSENAVSVITLQRYARIVTAGILNAQRKLDYLRMLQRVYCSE